MIIIEEKNYEIETIKSEFNYIIKDKDKEISETKNDYQILNKDIENLNKEINSSFFLKKL